MSVAELLKAEILNGALPPGTWLSQTDLAVRFGVSRIPVRDALQQLASERLVALVPGKGAQVIELSRDELSQVFDLRVLLECDLLRHAMSSVTDAHYAEVKYSLQKSSLEAGRSGWIEGDWLFHLTLYAPAGRQRQITIIEELRRNCILYSAQYDRLVDETPKWLHDHEEITCAYIEKRVDDAVQLLRDHIEAAKNCLIDVQMPKQ
ncbi:FCD domain-containing protein [Ensifer sp. T173]|uniref:FCD domain-containing protein n=1 Tax=Ensifer canadensis TaxID=555315 RepID=A0AAW4FRR6_9HYPH|nr:GntR family transcriptional regulator [Ensifer canadensis]MBM3094012.1 FCD domain-containing protein [Ensifer canadensis]UBI81076.1 GntR family transcriptional regulator [Ensifer canadensis]